MGGASSGPLFSEGVARSCRCRGGGREIIALRKAGFDAEGFECSLPLVRAGEELFNQLGEPKYVAYCPPDSVPAGPPIYDGLIIGWSAYTHVPTKERRIAFIQALRLRALPHSPLLFSFFTRLPRPYAAVTYRTSILTRCFLFGKRELHPGDHIEWGRYIHRFTREEVESELEMAGFRLAHFSEEGGAGQAVGIAE